MLLLAAISCMMVANPGMPDSKKEKEEGEDGNRGQRGRQCVRRLAGQRNKAQAETG